MNGGLSLHGATNNNTESSMTFHPLQHISFAIALVISSSAFAAGADPVQAMAKVAFPDTQKTTAPEAPLALPAPPGASSSNPGAAIPFPPPAGSDILPPKFIAPKAPQEPAPSARAVFSGHYWDTPNPALQMNMLSINEANAKWSDKQARLASSGAAPLSATPASETPYHNISLAPWIQLVLANGVSEGKVNLELSRLSPEEFKAWATRSR